MSIARDAARDTILLSGARLAAALISVGALLFYNRVLHASELALIPIVNMLAELGYSLASLGLGQSAARRMPALLETDLEAARTLAGCYWWTTACLGGLFAVSLAAASGLIGYGFFHEGGIPSLGYAHTILLLIPAVVVEIWHHALEIIFRGTQAYRGLSVFGLTFTVFRVMGIIVPYLIGGVRFMLLGMAVASAIPCIGATIRYRSFLFHRFSASALKRELVEAWPFYAETWVNYWFRYADQWLIGLFFSTRELAAYYTPRICLNRSMIVVNAFREVLTSTFARASTRGLDVVVSGFDRVRRAHVYFFVPLWATFFASSYYVIDLLAGSEYPEAPILLAMLTLSFLVRSIFSPHSLGVVVFGKPRQRLMAVLSQAVVGLSALGLLAYLLNLEGVAMARVFGDLTMAGVSWYILRRILPLRPNWMPVVDVLGPCLALLAIDIGGQFFLHLWLFSSGLDTTTATIAYRLITPLVLAAGACTYVFWFLRLIPEAEYRLFVEALPSRLRRIEWVLGKFRPVRS